MKKYAIIVAGGSGKRMGSEIPKQFLALQKKPILFQTLHKFENICDDIILVLPENQIEYFHKLCKKFKFNTKAKIVTGGIERFHSVKNGLDQLNLDNEAVVAVHDAVRPLVSKELIIKSFECAYSHGNCVVAVPSKDSLRKISEGKSKSVTRSEYFMVQTPQVFNLNILKEAYQQEYNNFTDDASVLESLGLNIHLLEGEYSNIKITTKEDLIIAEALLKSGFCE
ncbi:MAG: 2-C-methyl-D-erythritol 4-phosphate cytidylyltransferase [Cytophagales bacterium]